MPVVSASCYELLGVPVDAPPDQLRSAWSRRRNEAQARLERLEAADLEALCARIDEAFQILADPVRAARYRAFRQELDEADTDFDETPTLDDIEPVAQPEASVTDPGRRAPAGPEPRDSVALLRQVVQMASLSASPTQVQNELPPWRQPDAPVMQDEPADLAPASRVPGQKAGPQRRAPWDEG